MESEENKYKNKQKQPELDITAFVYIHAFTCTGLMNL